MANPGLFCDPTWNGGWRSAGCPFNAKVGRDAVVECGRIYTGHGVPGGWISTVANGGVETPAVGNEGLQMSYAGRALPINQ